MYREYISVVSKQLYHKVSLLEKQLVKVGRSLYYSIDIKFVFVLAKYQYKIKPNIYKQMPLNIFIFIPFILPNKFII
jgi:hypothetical protein